MIQKIGCFHLRSNEGLRPLDAFEAQVENKLSANDIEYFRDCIIVLPEAFNVIGEYKPRASYVVEPGSSVKLRLTQLAKQLGALFVVGLIDNDEANAEVPPFSSAYLVTSACCACLSRKTGCDETAKGVEGAKLYQPCGQAEDIPFLYSGETWIGSLLCMDTDPCSSQPHDPQTDNRERHCNLKKAMSKASTVPVLCVPARMRRMDTKTIEKDWRKMHFALANGSDGYPSVLRRCGGEPINFTDDLRVEPLNSAALGALN